MVQRVRDQRGWKRYAAGAAVLLAAVSVALASTPLFETNRVVLAPTSYGTATAPSLAWIDWTAPASYPNSATISLYSYNYATQVLGTIAIPGGSTVYVKLTGEIIDYPGSSGFGISGSSYWSNASGGGTNGAAFKSTNVPSLPTNSDRIGVSGSSTGGVQLQTLEFFSDSSRTTPVNMANLVMDIYSLGRPGVTGTWNFTQNFDILSDNAPPVSGYSGFTKGGGGPPYALNGNEGTGTIQFTGSYSSVAWTVMAPEFYATWNIGVTTATAPSDPSITPSTTTISGSTGTLITPVTFTDANFVGAVTYSVKSGTLPAGLSLNPSTGEITGTPTAPGTATVVIEATGATSGTAEATLDFDFVAPATVTFDTNGGTGGGPMAPQTAITATNLTSNTFTRAGYTFAGWNTAANGSGTAYANGASYPFTSDATMYAQWTANSNPITFDTGGGSSVSPGSFNTGGPVTLPPAPTRAGYEFLGWFTSPTGGTALTDGYQPSATSGITLYAQWREIVVTTTSTTTIEATPVVTTSTSKSSGLPSTGSNVVPLFLGGLLAIVVGFVLYLTGATMSFAGGRGRPSPRVAVADVRSRRRRSGRATTRPVSPPAPRVLPTPVATPAPMPEFVVEPVIEPEVFVEPEIVVSPVAELVDAPVAAPVDTIGTAVEAGPVAATVLEPVAGFVVTPVAPVESVSTTWMSPQQIKVSHLAQDWAMADRRANAAKARALRTRLGRLEGVAGEHAATWRARIEAELRALQA